MEKHLVVGFEGLLARVMYVFDDAVIFVAPPPAIGTAELIRVAGRNLKGAHAPTFRGEGLVTGAAKVLVKKRKFKHIKEFSAQFGTAGFNDPRITSTMLAEQLEHTQRLPLEQVHSVDFKFLDWLLPPQIVVEFVEADGTGRVQFRMRYRLPKAAEVHAALTAVLGSRVAPINTP